MKINAFPSTLEKIRKSGGAQGGLPTAKVSSSSALPVHCGGALLVRTTWAPQVLGHHPLWQGQSPPPRTKENPGGSPPGSDTGHHSALWPESATRPHPRRRGQAVKFYHVPMTAPVTAIFTGRTMTLPTELKTGARNGRRNSHNGHQVSQRTFHWLRLRAWRESSGHIHKLSLSLGQLWSNVRAQTEPPQGPTPSLEGGR